MNFHRLAAIGTLIASVGLSGCVPAAQVVGSAALSALWDEIKDHNKNSPDNVPAPAKAEIKKSGPVVKVAAAPLQLGSEWQYDDNYGLQVDGVSGNEIRFRRTDDPTQWIVRRGFVREDSQSSTSKRQMMFSDLATNAGAELTDAQPLVYRREFRDNGILHDQVTSWTIEGHQQITVPAGSFDCYVIVTRTRSQTDNWTSFERWYYAPTVGNYVRMEYQYGDTTGSRVLMSYKLLGSDGAVVASAGPQDPFQSRFADNTTGHDETNFVVANTTPDKSHVAPVKASVRPRNPATVAKASDADAMRALINQLNEVPPSGVVTPVPVSTATALPATTQSPPVETAPSQPLDAVPVSAPVTAQVATSQAPSTPAAAGGGHPKHPRGAMVAASDDTRSLNEQQMAGITPTAVEPAVVASSPQPVVASSPQPVVDAQPEHVSHVHVAALAKADDTRSLNEQQMAGIAPPTAQLVDAPSPSVVDVHPDHAKHTRTTTLAKSDDTRSLNQQQIDQLASASPRPM